MASFTVTDELSGERLDKALAKLAPGLSRARVKKAIEEGAVRVNGRVLAKGATVSPGDVLTVEGAAATPDAPATPEPDAPLTVRFESPQVLVVDKPAGQPSAPLRSGETGTLANALVGKYPELAGIGHGPREPGLVHRLDTDTSGLVVVARTKEAFDILKGALKEERLAKRYLLVCAAEDLPDQGSIEYPLANHPKDQRRVYPCIHPRDVARYAPRPARTEYSVVRRGGSVDEDQEGGAAAAEGRWALVEVRVAKALRHQIRAHFAALEHPLAGDVLYGGAEVRALGRHALHASRITFDGEGVVPKFDVEAPLPPEMVKLLAS